MNRISEIEIAGKKYPLNFSVKAARAVDEKFGSLDNLSGVFGWENVSTSLYNVAWVLRMLMEQGAAYRKLVDGEEIEIPTEDELELLVGAPDLPRLQIAILKSMGLSAKPTVEVEPEKNAETTQEN